MKRKWSRIRLPAKFVGPDVGQAVFRTRLFELIEAREAACLWVHGPPGSGKTTLIASYLEAYRLSPVWYGVDAEDRELSTFFHFLAMAIKFSVPARHKMPVAEAESRDDWIGFARRFFCTMLAGLAEDDVLVFENIHEAKGALDEVLALLVAEAGSRQKIVFTSHYPPPPAFVDVLAKQQLVELNADALRFDQSEVNALVAGITGTHPARDDIEKLQALTHGWAAGIVLLCSQPAAVDLDDVGPASRTRLFEYFSHLVIGKMPAEARTVLEACAFLPDFDGELAVAASRNPNAAELLENLYRNGLFVERRMAGKTAVFRFHTLLADALRDRVGIHGGASRQKEAVRAGRLMAGCGRIEASIPLLMEGGASRDAAARVLDIAEAVVAEGRLEQLASWITALPRLDRANLPWLDYWLGMSFALTDESAARSVLADVYLRFKRSGDQLGCVLSAAAMVSSIESGWQDYEGFDHWIGTLHSHWSPDLSFPTADSELRAIVGLLSVQVGANTQEQVLTGLRSRAAILIRTVKDANTQLSAAVLTVNSFVRVGDFESALFFENFIQHEVRLEQAGPSWRANWHWTLSMMHVTGSQILKRPALTESGRKHRVAAAHIAEKHVLTMMKVSIAHAEAGRCIWARDVEGLKQALDSVEAQIQPGRVRQMIWHLNRRAHLGLLSDRPDEAWIAISRVIELADQAHYPHIESCVYYNVAASALVHLKRYDEALAYHALILPGATARTRLTCEMGILFVHAMRSMDGMVNVDSVRDVDQDRGEDGPWRPTPVADFFRAIREKRMLEYGRVEDHLLARLCAVALLHDIENEFVRSFILHRKFLPPANAPANWPWPLKIEALGGFTVRIGGVPLVFEGKGQKKPFELLQLMVTLQGCDNGGAGPKVQRVMDELWPSLEAKDPQASFDTTLHRLRKLIGVEGAIILADGRLSLNRALVWCDVLAFETMARASSADEQMRALAHYAGPLFDSTIHAWSVAPRERLAALYTGLVERTALRMEDARDHKGAIGLYERALQQDNLIEPFYRGLMRCHHAVGEDTEALRTYRRCRELLSIVLGTTPTAATEAVRAKIDA
ncbi:MAG: hypothetical protein LH481_17255 [Burkholderiales bacterium]|nr:hypothetical protein [Burkholderiales bacterium]